MCGSKDAAGAARCAGLLCCKLFVHTHVMLEYVRGESCLRHNMDLSTS